MRRGLFCRSAGGFALLELLVVVALILVLTTLYWGGNSGSKEKALQKACAQNLQKISMAIQIYANDYKGNFPAIPSAISSEQPLNLLIPKYTVEREVFICPGGRDAPVPGSDGLTNHTISYAYYMGRSLQQPQDVLITDRQVDTNSKAAGQLIFSENGKGPGANHQKYGGNLLFVDGSIQGSPPRAAVALPTPPGVVLLNPNH